jgi:hypothetical protein
MPEVSRIASAAALAESGLLAGRIEFFDLRKPDQAAGSFARALQFAGDAEDSLLGAAILAHAAFVPGWNGDRAGASERLTAARSHARRGGASELFSAWIDAVDAECAERCGEHADALALIARAQTRVRSESAPVGVEPAWFDWFTPVRLAAFGGRVQLAAGKWRQAERTLTGVLDEFSESDVKQRSVVLADLAAAVLARDDYRGCCERLGEALDGLAQVWYATGMERIREVRRTLGRWQDEPEVRALDERLYDWDTSVSMLRG